MQQCSHCQGFLPQESNVCPHCGEAHSSVEISTKSTKKSRIFAKLSWKQRLAAAAETGAVMFTLMACYGVSPYYADRCEAVDKDHDGYSACKPGSVGTLGADEDCNDNDPKIHPRANDIPGDNIDQNCNGIDGK